jgi:hypothetical protein
MADMAIAVNILWKDLCVMPRLRKYYVGTSEIQQVVIAGQLLK